MRRGLIRWCSAHFREERNVQIPKSLLSNIRITDVVKPLSAKHQKFVIHAGTSLAELLPTLCSEGKTEEIAANLLFRALDAIEHEDNDICLARVKGFRTDVYKAFETTLSQGDGSELLFGILNREILLSVSPKIRKARRLAVNSVVLNSLLNFLSANPSAISRINLIYLHQILGTDTYINLIHVLGVSFASLPDEVRETCMHFYLYETGQLHKAVYIYARTFAELSRVQLERASIFDENVIASLVGETGDGDGPLDFFTPICGMWSGENLMKEILAQWDRKSASQLHQNLITLISAASGRLQDPPVGVRLPSLCELDHNIHYIKKIGQEKASRCRQIYDQRASENVRLVFAQILNFMRLKDGETGLPLYPFAANESWKLEYAVKKCLDLSRCELPESSKIYALALSNGSQMFNATDLHNNFKANDRIFREDSVRMFAENLITAVSPSLNNSISANISVAPEFDVKLSGKNDASFLHVSFADSPVSMDAVKIPANLFSSSSVTSLPILMNPTHPSPFSHPSIVAPSLLAEESESFFDESTRKHSQIARAAYEYLQSERSQKNQQSFEGERSTGDAVIMETQENLMNQEFHFTRLLLMEKKFDEFIKMREQVLMRASNFEQKINLSVRTVHAADGTNANVRGGGIERTALFKESQEERRGGERRRNLSAQNLMEGIGKKNLMHLSADDSESDTETTNDLEEVPIVIDLSDGEENEATEDSVGSERRRGEKREERTSKGEDTRGEKDPLDALFDSDEEEEGKDIEGGEEIDEDEILMREIGELHASIVDGVKSDEQRDVKKSANFDNFLKSNNLMYNDIKNISLANLMKMATSNRQLNERKNAGQNKYHLQGFLETASIPANCILDVKSANRANVYWMDRELSPLKNGMNETAYNKMMGGEIDADEEEDLMQNISIVRKRRGDGKIQLSPANRAHLGIYQAPLEQKMERIGEGRGGEVGERREIRRGERGREEGDARTRLSRDEKASLYFFDALLPESNIHRISSNKDVETVKRFFDANRVDIVGYDCEWSPGSQLPSIMQIATPEHAFIFDVFERDTSFYESFGSLMNSIFANNAIIKIGFAGQMDIYRLNLMLQYHQSPHQILTLNNIIDLQEPRTEVFDEKKLNRDAINQEFDDTLFDAVSKNDVTLFKEYVASKKKNITHPLETEKQLKEWKKEISTNTRQHFFKNMSLSSLCERSLGIYLSKKYQKSDWGCRPLSSEQIKYAAYDAYVLLLVETALRKNNLMPWIRGAHFLRSSPSASKLLTQHYDTISSHIKTPLYHTISS